MKRLITGIILFYCTLPVNGQDTTDIVDTSRVYHIIGMNTVNFINQIIYTGYQPFRYLLNYRIDFGQKAIRFGLGGDFRRYHRSQFPPFQEVNRSYSYSLTGRFGFEWKKEITGRWEFFYGPDQIIEWGKEKTIRKENISGIETERISFYKEINIGVGATIGINFVINKRIFIGTETNIIVTYFIGEGNSFFSTQTTQDTGVSSQIIYPGLIWLYVKL
ncbi:MAG: hypothetical protein HYY40_13815 [Bacteroidetes bacterium]|nr:hypothetical protein [Bacteroidota bacterium]